MRADIRGLRLSRLENRFVLIMLSGLEGQAPIQNSESWPDSSDTKEHCSAQPPRQLPAGTVFVKITFLKIRRREPLVVACTR